ncbi:MAG TPA: type I DNA topoisomerase [bacterium]|nr:type I DNA topoisomerase [bacterium]
MKKGVIIVESPTKAKTISGILGKEYTITATMGHVRDLPKNKFGVNIEKNFEPTYVISPGKRKIVSKIKKLTEDIEEIFMATDEDREGEAIAWHTTIAIGKEIDDVKRVAFHEIVPDAVKKSFANPRKISIDLVNAQQARRILDRIVGYTLSPLLGRYLERGLSAGRVQSVALRLIVEREEEIENFIPKTYFVIKVEVEKDSNKINFTLTEIDGKKIEKNIEEEKEVEKILEELKGGVLVVKDKKELVRKIKPLPPFITSTLQQESSIKLGFSSSKTMVLAQQLYEGIDIEGKSVGLITYMRTDSPSVAKPAQNSALKFIKENIGKEYLPEKPNLYKSSSKLSQEAHESIRPTYVDNTPEKIKGYLNEDQFKLYSLIWNRFIASQMKNAEVKNIKVEVENGKYKFFAENNQITFDGFMKIWPIKIDTGENYLDKIEIGEELKNAEHKTEKHQTKPPARYTEATLIKTLEKYGIGRPSTYAPTISTLFSRGYIKNQNRALIPLKIGRIVHNVLKKFFSDIIRIDFTAKMEEDLDEIARGEKNYLDVLNEFYTSYKKILDQTYQKINESDIINEIVGESRKCPHHNVNLVVKQGKYGIFLACPKFPECKYTERVKENEGNTRNRYRRKQSRKVI